MEWVRAHAAELVAIAARFGASGVCLCGSVARGTDGDDSDLDFYVRHFDETDPEGGGRSEPRQRADDLVDAYRKLSPYRVDVRPLPGWLLDPPFEAAMQRDAIDLEQLIKDGTTT